MRWSMIQIASRPASSAVRVMARMSAKWGVPPNAESSATGRMTPMPIGRSLTGQRLSPAATAAPAPIPSPRCIIGFPLTMTPRRHGHVTRLASATCGTPETAEPLLLGAPLLNFDDRTAESLQRAVDPARGRWLHEPSAAEQGKNQPDDDADELFPAKPDATAGQVELVGEERADCQQGADHEHDAGHDAHCGSCTGLWFHGNDSDLSGARQGTLDWNDLGVLAENRVTMRRSRVLSISWEGSASGTALKKKNICTILGQDQVWKGACRCAAVT